jgi:hypothetical protein
VRAIYRAKEEIGMPPSVQAAFQGTRRHFKTSLANEPMLISGSNCDGLHCAGCFV